jgi:hypothetical protein
MLRPCCATLQEFDLGQVRDSFVQTIQYYSQEYIGLKSVVAQFGEKMNLMSRKIRAARLF